MFLPKYPDSPTPPPANTHTPTLRARLGVPPPMAEAIAAQLT